MPTQGDLRVEVEQLIRETESYEDALNYIEEVATDCNVTVEVAIRELRFQYGISC